MAEQPKPNPKPPTTPPDRPQPKTPIGDPPSKDKPRIAQPKQMTLEPGDHGRGDGPLHTAPLVRNSPRQMHYGPGTYGNDQFAAEHHDAFEGDGVKPEGLDETQSAPRRPTARPKEKRYGRQGGEGQG
jgi:hypothetical protein